MRQLSAGQIVGVNVHVRIFDPLQGTGNKALVVSSIILMIEREFRTQVCLIVGICIIL